MNADGLVVGSVRVDRGAGDVLHDVSLRARPGELTVVLGPNGAGKTTLLDSISGLVRPHAGSVHMDGTDLLRLSRRRRSRCGVRHVEQGRTVFTGLTVRENLTVVAGARFHEPVLQLFPELAARLDSPAELLSGGEQQMLVIARALLEPHRRHARSRMRLLLVDELSLGLAPVVVRRLLPVIRALADDGAAVLLVEQFVHQALPVADFVYILDRGRVTFSGSADELRARPEMLHDAYFLGSGPQVTPTSGPAPMRGTPVE